MLFRSFSGSNLSEGSEVKPRKVQPTLETVRIAGWDFVDNFCKGRAHFRIPMQVLGLLKRIY